MGSLAASIASHVPSWLLSAGLSLASPGEIVRRTSSTRLEDDDDKENKERFVRAYERLKTELLNDRAFNFDFTEETRQWVAKVRVLLVGLPCRSPESRQLGLRAVHNSTLENRSEKTMPDKSWTNSSKGMMDYNVPGGKLNRGLSVIDSYMLLREGTEVDDEDFYLACVLGWCVEWVGMSAINDAVLLKCHVQAIIKRYFKEKVYFLDLMELWNEIGLQTAMGQMLDLITTHTGAKDLARYRIQGYRRLVACALLLNGAKLSDYAELKNVLIEMGVYFQIQDDYLDCFGDPEVIGKVGTDIEDYKCSWLIVQAMELANENEMKILRENYGKSDPQCAAAVKNAYKELDLQDIYLEYESRVHKHLVSTIGAEPDHASREIMKIFLKKIYRRKK
ncbi:hypothetical protein HU200_057852 [Digitaria exilis]|uniref:Uncharacterized protein n=1 Tax=Digitaria exilis TaxID=1010633 RepID=A0A835AKD0_9POAL|nr:hypothetical protein HU200_057852 [Digitaria exilis]